MSTYLQIKIQLKESAIEAKKKYPKDKPAIRMIINDTVDYLSKENNLSERQRSMLSNYACKLHPKD